MLSSGVDLIQVSRIERALQRHGQRFLRRIYTPLEVAICRGRTNELAVRFAAKEAVSKALGVGIFSSNGIGWQEVEVLPDRLGKPLVYLHGKALQRARELGLEEFALSLTHDGDLAVALVVAHGPGRGDLSDPLAWREALARWVGSPEKPKG